MINLNGAIVFLALRRRSFTTTEKIRFIAVNPWIKYTRTFEFERDCGLGDYLGRKTSEPQIRGKFFGLKKQTA